MFDLIDYITDGVLYLVSVVKMFFGYIQSLGALIQSFTDTAMLYVEKIPPELIAIGTVSIVVGVIFLILGRR